MTTSAHTNTTLWNALRASGPLTGRFLQDAEAHVPLTDLLSGSALYGRGEELQDRSVLLATRSQLTTASALMELDGLARRIVLCPPELPMEHLPWIIEMAEIDGVVSDRGITHVGGAGPLYFSPCSRSLEPGNHDRRARHETEWILLTSGTTGLPKLVVHTLATLTAAIQPAAALSCEPVVWSTFYDIRRYGGLQIFLRAILTGASLVLSGAEEAASAFLSRAATGGVTHISGTPSHWRRALMSPSSHLLQPRYVRLSGETVDQAILNRLQVAYPQARVVHAFASTEAGVAFEVYDGAEGFPAPVLNATGGVEMKVEDGTLRIRSAGNALRYLGNPAPRLTTADGFIDTSDFVQLRDGRFYFAGRCDGVINVGGLKVHPEEVEAVISRHPQVEMCVVRARKSSVTGAVVVADVVLKAGPFPGTQEGKGALDDILQLCREALPSYKVPAAVNIVPMLNIAGSGKVLRRNA
jgi:acyl-CoA synthetase (AMP-forming)/AMP-acid ligase II